MKKKLNDIKSHQNYLDLVKVLTSTMRNDIVRCNPRDILVRGIVRFEKGQRSLSRHRHHKGLGGGKVPPHLDCPIRREIDLYRERSPDSLHLALVQHGFRSCILCYIIIVIMIIVIIVIIIIH